MNDNEHPYGLVECLRFGKIYGQDARLWNSRGSKWRSANGAERERENEWVRANWGYVNFKWRKTKKARMKKRAREPFLMKQQSTDVSLSTESIVNSRWWFAPSLGQNSKYRTLQLYRRIIPSRHTAERPGAHSLLCSLRHFTFSNLYHTRKYFAKNCLYSGPHSVSIYTYT